MGQVLDQVSESNAQMNSLYMERLVLLVSLTGAMGARLFCDRTKVPVELGQWRRDLAHMDTATIENPPVSLKEGQIYVYENYFPNRTIRYIHVDNLAIRSCGASASIKAGGVDTSGVLITLHAEPHQEIRSVIDIWGSKADPVKSTVRASPNRISADELKDLKSRYLFAGLRAVNHNFHPMSDYFPQKD